MNEFERNSNEKLMEAVSNFDVEGVERCLASGADPNFDVSGKVERPEDAMQPATPLQLVVFRISDCDLGDNDLKEFARIATLLLRHGADPAPALKMAESRYGPYPTVPEDSAFLQVWRVLVEAGTSPTV